MPVAYSTSGSFSASGPASSASSSTVNVGAGTGRKLIVFPSSEFNNLANMEATSVTYDGNSLTKVTSSDQNVGSSFFNRISAWFYDIPDGHTAGDKTLTVNFAGSISDIAVQWIVVTGAATGQPGTCASYTNASDDSNALSVTVAAANSLVLSACSHGNANTWTHDAAQTEAQDLTIGTSSACSSYKAASSNTTMTDTTTGANRFVQIAFTIAPPASGQTIAVGLAGETDSSLAVGRIKVRALGLTTESDSAFAVARQKVRHVGLAAELGAALAVGRAKLRALGLAGETDTAFVVVPRRTHTIGLAQEVNTALELLFGVPSLPGIEYTAPANRLHFLAPDQLLHYVADANLLHFAAPSNLLHFETPMNRLHYSAPEED